MKVDPLLRLFHFPDEECPHHRSTSIISNIPADEISDRIFDGKNTLLPFVRVLCLTQAVERGVKLVTAASQLVCGANDRNRLIKNRIGSSQRMASFNNKKDNGDHQLRIAIFSLENSQN